MRWPWVSVREVDSLIAENKMVRAHGESLERDVAAVKEERDDYRRHFETCDALRLALVATLERERATWEATRVAGKAENDRLRSSLRLARQAVQQRDGEKADMGARLGILQLTLEAERARTKAAEDRYHDLVVKSLTPMPAKVDAPADDFEQRARHDISEETIQRATADLMHAGMDAKLARAEAERMFRAVDGVADEAGLMMFAEGDGT